VIEQKKKEIIETDVEERGPLADRLLFWLLKHPYQRLSDLEFAFQISASTIWRHLKILKQQALVEAVMATIVSPGRPGALYYLSPRGTQRVADLVGRVDPTKLARMWKANEAALLHLLPRLGSYLPLQDAVLGFIADVPRQLASPGGYPAAIRWHWQQDYVHQFERKKKQRSCRADGVVVFRRRPLTMTPQEEETDSWYCVLWMVDPGFAGSNDLPMMRQRLEQLLHWRESSERWSFYRTFPPVLVLAPTSHQRDLWIYSAQEATAHLRVAPLKGAATLQGEGSPWRYPWRALDGSGATSLQSLITPLAVQAIPPGLLAPKQIERATMRKRANTNDTEETISFATRATHLQTNGSDLKSQEEIPLLSLCLSYRHIDLLKEIYTVPLIAPQELAALVQRTSETLQRYLFDLHHFHCLETITTSCGKRLILTETGLRLIAALLGVRLVHLAEHDAATQRWQQRGVRQALQTINHTAGIYTFLAHLQTQARKVGQDLLWWETTRCFRRYRLQGAWHNLMPDALFAYQAKETRVEAWLEWDTGSMHRKPLMIKFQSYAQYVRSQQYRHEHTTPPTLLIVAPQTGREQFLRRIIASAPATLPLAIWTTTEQLLTVRGPLAAIWKPMRSGGDIGADESRSTWA
jgi:Replication-relaxation/Bacterial regulatory protein, arsR family